MWQLRCIATSGHPTPRQSLSTLTSSPVPSLKSLRLCIAILERFNADMLRYAATLNFDPMSLTFDFEHL